MNEIFVILIVIFITGLTVYIHQKLKNQATKQDIAGITNEVEKVKSKYIFQLEELKLDLEHKSAAVSQKRDLYKKVTDTMRIFIRDRKNTRLNSSHVAISYAVFCLKKKKNKEITRVPHILILSIRQQDR